MPAPDLHLTIAELPAGDQAIVSGLLAAIDVLTATTEALAIAVGMLNDLDTERAAEIAALRAELDALTAWHATQPTALSFSELVQHYTKPAPVSLRVAEPAREPEPAVSAVHYPTPEQELEAYRRVYFAEIQRLREVREQGEGGGESA